VDVLCGKPRGQQKLDAMEERLHDNLVTPILDQVCFRLDFSAWLKTLTARERRIIRWMMKDERTKDLAQRFRISAPRISQLRREFRRGWQTFIGDFDTEAVPA
jgi:DNA-directed RNA polymerase sigma subunit (sigma70/sigma32)